MASIEWFAEEAKRSCGDVLETTDARRRFLTLRQPVGIVGAITPWNFVSGGRGGARGGAAEGYGPPQALAACFFRQPHPH